MSDYRYIPRWLQKQLELALGTMPVVVLTGARQTGKSTLVRHLQPHRRYLTLDDLGVLDQAKRDPDSLLMNPPLTLDEVQRAPELLLEHGVEPGEAGRKVRRPRKNVVTSKR